MSDEKEKEKKVNDELQAMNSMLQSLSPHLKDL